MTDAVERPRAGSDLRVSDTAFRVRGDVADITATQRDALFDRRTSVDQTIRPVVASIIARVRRDGDEALRVLARELDGVQDLVIEVPRDMWLAALASLHPSLHSALSRAAANIRRAHEEGRPVATVVETEPGVLIERRPDPLDRVGVYAPGGRAAYPSSVLMGAVPARVAGVREVIVCSPPGRNGHPPLAVLAAAAIAGVDRVFAIGGAGAIAAMAMGTDSVPRVDRVVGPGNAYVVEAKIQLAGEVATDAPAGPTELLVLADATTDPMVIGREVIAQAEHDPRAAVVVVIVCDGARRHADQVASVIMRLASEAPRQPIVAQALGERGGLLTASTMDAGIAFANAWAPEHLLIVSGNPEAVVPRIRAAGTICVGATTSVVFGDYLTGANHVLPTAGLARSYSGLSTLDFVRWTTIQRVTPAAAARLAPDVAILAEAERLPSHAAAARAAGADERVA